MNSPTPKVSVIMPVFNGSRYLAQAIDSVIAQTYHNVEIIVVNDGSNDGGATRAVALSYGDRLLYMEQENQGVAGALNTGIHAMKGEFFCWLSHDDAFLPEKIERQVDAYHRIGRNDVVLFSDYQLMDESGQVTGAVALASVIGNKPAIARFRGCINGCTVFVPKRAFNTAGLFNRALRYTQDYDLWTKMSNSFLFIHMPELLVRTRLHGGQGSHEAAAALEGNSLWIAMADRTTPAERALLSGSSHGFFHDLAEFLGRTPYLGAAPIIEEMATAAATPLVSIVVPVINEFHLAERAIKSALLQSYSNIEVLVLIDKKADDAKRLINLGEEDPRVYVTHDDGGGSGSARNLGMDLARGEYIAFLDHDDWFMPTKIAQQVSAMITRRFLVSHTSYLVVYPSRNLGPTTMDSGKLSGRLFPKLICNCPIALPTVMIHRAIPAAGFRFSESNHLGADCIMWAEIAREYEFLGIDIPLTVVEWADGSAAINLRKQLTGVTMMRDYYLNDPIYRCCENEIANLGVTINRLDMLLSNPNNIIPDASYLDEAVIKATFEGQAR